MKKTLLTLESLFQFFSENNIAKFDSKESDCEIHVQVPALFKAVDEDDNDRRGMMKVKIKVFHTGLNRNGSYVSESAAEAAMPTIKNRPILGYIHQLDNGEWDFEGHNVEIVQGEDGEEEMVYTEHQIGSFSEEMPFFEHDDATGKDYVTAYGYIPEEYTKACDILRRKQGTKNSCELSIESLSYNAKEKYLDLESFYVCGSTFLGAEEDGTEINEGMLGSRADIVDFGKPSDGVPVASAVDGPGLIQTLEKLNETLSKFAEKEKKKEGGEFAVMLDKMLEKYGKAIEEVPFDCSSLSDEELESKFAETFGEEADADADGEEAKELEEEAGEVKEEEELAEEDADEEPEGKENFRKVFEISHEDIRSALYALLTTYEESDGEWYWITAVYDSYFAYENWDGSKIYGQNYSKENDSVAFEGERFSLHRELLTDSEYAELQSIRADYSLIKGRLEEYEAKEEMAKKEAVLNKEEYASYLDSEEFKSLKDDMGKYTAEEFEEKAELAFAKCVRKFGLVAGAPKGKAVNRINLPFTPTKKKSKYSLLFSNNK